MPVRSRSNNRVPPANNHAASVAAAAIKSIIPVQQRRTYNAHVPQGFTGILYAELGQGLKCTCHGSRSALGHRLGEDGKASPAAITELVTGLQVSIEDYGTNDLSTGQTSPNAPVDKYQGVFDTHAGHPDGYQDNALLLTGETFRDDGPSNEVDIDEAFGNFDPGIIGYTDAACPVCFGTSFVGGFAPDTAFRFVGVPNSAEASLDSQSEIQADKTPWSCLSMSVTFTLTLPRGVVGIDVCRMMNGRRPIKASCTVNGLPLNYTNLMAACTGRTATFVYTWSSLTEWTHFELQLAQSSLPLYFELPRLAKSSDLSKLDPTDPFQVIVSPMTQNLKEKDVIVESSSGRILFVSSINPWDSRERNILGWECQVRVVQQEEIFTILPRRGHVLSKPATTNMVHTNKVKS